MSQQFNQQGVPHGEHGKLPIAEQFMSTDTPSYSHLGSGRAPLNEGITGRLDGETGSHHSHHTHGATAPHSDLALGKPIGATSGAATGYAEPQSSFQTSQTNDAVSGAYEGGTARDAIGGQSHAHTTGPGVGVLGENTRHHESTHHTGAGAAGLATGAGVGAGVGAIGGNMGVQGTQTGVGPSGGAGGHYRPEEQTGSNLVGQSAGNTGRIQDTTKDNDPNRGAPISDPKDLDTGGPHSLVFQESTGKYVHRREL